MEVLSSLKMIQNKPSILLVEDEPDIAELISAHLKRKDYEVKHLLSGKEALDYIQEDSNNCHKKFDLFILDRMLPEVDGIEICKFIRLYKKTKEHPILFLTALGEADHVVQGLNAGADDYVTKPFHPGVLLARVESLLRRSQLQKEQSKSEPSHTFEHMGIKVDRKQCLVWLDNELINLTKSEFRLTLTLIEEPGKVFTRKQLVDLIQDGPIHVTNRTIDTHIFGLRKKLKDKADFIETVRGIGYRIKI